MILFKELLRINHWIFLIDMKLKYFIFVFLVLFFEGCGKEKKKPAFYDIEPDSLEYTKEISEGSLQMLDADIISVPFKERAGVKYVKVSVNGLEIEMIFDTGCSGTLISVAEANYLYQKGYLTTNDIIGMAQSQIADGSIVENMVVNLKEVIIDGKIQCMDVIATVSSNNNAPLLLGNEVLNRVASYVVDNKNKTINFKLR